MSYAIEFSEEFERSLLRLKKRDPVMFERVKKKVGELVEKPEHYKPLRNVLAGFRRIHFGSFVLVYTIEGNTVRIISLDHHDQAY